MGRGVGRMECQSPQILRKKKKFLTGFRADIKTRDS